MSKIGINAVVRNIDGVGQAEAQSQLSDFLEQEKAKSFASFIKTYGCPFGNPDITSVYPAKRQSVPQNEVTYD
jgi:hypothetical protein